MSFLAFLFRKPFPLNPGTPVNRVSQGRVDRFDGVVLAQTDEGVIVEWPRYGCSVEDRSQLAVIAS